MIEVKYGINYDNSQGIQFALPNQKLEIADERYVHVVLPLKDSDGKPMLEEEGQGDDAKKVAEDMITIQQLGKCNLLVIRAEKSFEKDSKSKLMYKIEGGDFLELDAPLFLLGKWIKSFNETTDDLTITFKLELDPEKYKGDLKEVKEVKDEVKVEVAIGWNKTLEIDTSGQTGGSTGGNT